jgi:hypothetical protein
MPVTPLHMGPGIALKAIAGERFSLMVFGFSQVAMDIEPMVRVLRGDTFLHGWTHTYAGAAAIGILSVAAGKPICDWLLRWWKPVAGEPFMAWLRGEERIRWGAATLAAFLGTFSHVLLDSIMHSDMQPAAPFSTGNALLAIIPVTALHWACLASGALGVAALVGIYHARRDGRGRR